MTLKSGAGSACAACKFQRRKCTPSCLLAPYFPAEHSGTFKDVHHLYGVSNVVKILKTVDHSKHKEAMDTIIYEAYMRNKYPITGCCGLIAFYKTKIAQMLAELQYLYSRLEFCKTSMAESTMPHPFTDNTLALPPADSQSSNCYSENGDVLLLENIPDSEGGFFNFKDRANLLPGQWSEPNPLLSVNDDANFSLPTLFYDDRNYSRSV